MYKVELASIDFATTEGTRNEGTWCIYRLSHSDIPTYVLAIFLGVVVVNLKGHNFYPGESLNRGKAAHSEI